MNRQFLLPEPPSTYRRWGKLYGASRSLALAEAAQRHDGLTVIVCGTMAEVLQLEAEVNFFLNKSFPVQVFPDWETLPYDPFSPHPDIVAQRIRTLYQLPTLTKGVLILPVANLMQRVAPAGFVGQNALLLKSGELVDRDELRTQLVESGYRSVSEVAEHGEFAVRGSILDLFPTASDAPYRLDFFDDEIDSIRQFDPDTQLTEKKVDEIQLLPAHEFPVNEESTARFRREFRALFASGKEQSSIYRDVSNGLMPSGIEYYQPLFFDKMATLTEYFPKSTQLLTLTGWETAATQYWQQISERYEQLRHNIDRPLLAPDKLFISAEQTLDDIGNFTPIEVSDYECPDTQTDSYNFTTRASARYPANPRQEAPLAALKQFLASFNGRILYTAESPGRREALSELLQDNQLRPKAVDSWQSFLKSTAKSMLTVAPLQSGLTLESDIAIIDESQLLSDKPQTTKKQRQRRDKRRADAIISNLTDLRIGAPVVHIDHGVGRYLGLITLDIGGITTEFLSLEYAAEDKLYVPVSSLHLISRYTGADADGAPMHRLGSEQWEKAKRKAAEKARDAAAELLEIHAKRAARKGHSFNISASNYQSFATSFTFEETPDQAAAIEAVLDDMQSKNPMDRVVCGDVGFGKTEVAMRAAFAAVDGGKQVVVLVPTTLLAHQHHQNFLDRFAEWPIQIECLSRFRTKKETDIVIKDLAEGKVDIVIGTHKLIQKNITYDNLGLVIIDEEHRFGVRHKEQLKSLRAEVDILTLTATPIPRTLNMSLAGIRDLSIIATAPTIRQSIKTFVSEWNDATIREACQRELARGGQVYFLHNEVKSIEKMARTLSELLPAATVRFAHGQMRESELESVMFDFYHRQFNLLVCTTIVESGIDIPTANTIIINRADKLGLAQLHQLRGRVGRSHHRAYAYMIAPPKAVLTPDAEKRLKAIESLEDLGSGFTLATHDLEIRGAGELLGDGQSGQIQQIGFTLYTDLLDRAVKALQKGELPSNDISLMSDHTDVDLHLPALLPDDYVYDVHQRLVLYKRISSAADDDALKQLQIELIDRFGLLPEPTKTLFALTSLKIQCQNFGIKKLDAYATGGRIQFTPRTLIDPMTVIKMVQSQPKTYRFEGQDVLRFSAEIEARDDRVEFVEELLKKLTPSN